MGSIYARGRKLWLRFKGSDGKWTQRPSPLLVGQEREARKLLERLEGKIAAGAELSEAELGPVTVERFAKRWLEDRKTLVADWKSDEGRLRLHVLPKLGVRRLDEVRPRHLIALVKDLRRAGKHKPKTIRAVYAVTRTMFRDAVRADLIDSSPCVLTRRDLPETDDTAEWRYSALYSRDEFQTLISDERIPLDRRVLYALEGIGALRHGEVAGLLWRHYDADLKPLGRLTVTTSYDRGRTKSGKTRRMPVHPTLAAILAEWRLHGWPAMFGRQPGPDDLVLPVAPGGKAAAGSMRKAHNSWLALQGDLDALGLRRRRAHDLRRTMISLTRDDGARVDVLKTCTHGASKAVIDLIHDLRVEDALRRGGEADYSAI